MDAQRYRQKMAALRNHFGQYGGEQSAGTVVGALSDAGVRVSPALVMKAQAKFAADGLQEDTEGDSVSEDSAGVFFGYLSIPLNHRTTWAIIVTSTVVAAAACYFLVDATLTGARTLQVPAFFVAVIVAAAASSVPDTFLAIAAARRGDDSGAVSNAFGSNIFDICVCLSIPLLVNSYLTGWQPVSLLQDGKPIPGLMGLRLLLVVLTITNLVIMWHNRQITRTKAIAMCGLYLVFIGYAVLGSLGYIS
jgi:cation:H+ antiporter